MVARFVPDLLPEQSKIGVGATLVGSIEQAEVTSPRTRRFTPLIEFQSHDETSFGFGFDRLGTDANPSLIIRTS